MNVNLLPFAVLWAVMALVVLALIVVRKRISSGEDDTLHVMEGDARMIPHQVEMARKLEVVDRWGKILTVVTLIFGLIVGALWVYQGWVNASNYMAH